MSATYLLVFFSLKYLHFRMFLSVLFYKLDLPCFETQLISSRMLTASLVLLTHTDRNREMFIVHLVLTLGHVDDFITFVRKITLLQLVLLGRK